MYVYVLFKIFINDSVDSLHCDSLPFWELVYKINSIKDSLTLHDLKSIVHMCGCVLRNVLIGNTLNLKIMSGDIYL